MSFKRFSIRKEKEMKSLFGKFAFVLVAIVALSAVAGVAISGQNINISLASKNPSGAYVADTVDGLGNTITAIGISSYLNASGVPFVVKTGAGRIGKVNVTSAAGVITFYDAASTVGVGAASTVAVIPAIVGTYDINFPVSQGIVIAPSSSVASFSYQ